MDDSRFVFILGAARSGTKMLRDLLGESENVCTIPYDVNYIWRYRNEAFLNDALGPELADPRVSNFIRNTLVSMSGIGKRDSRHLIVEKTVSNSLRVPFVDRIFPGSRYIHLIRDGRDVAESALRMWRAPTDTRYLLRKLRYFPLRNMRYALWYAGSRIRSAMRPERGAAVWGPRYPGIEEDVERLPLIEVTARQWLWSVTSALDSLGRIPETRKFTVAYEDLVTSPVPLERICEFLEIADPRPVLEAYRANVNCQNIGKFRALSDDDQQRVISVQRETLSVLGYS